MNLDQKNRRWIQKNKSRRISEINSVRSEDTNCIKIEQVNKATMDEEQAKHLIVEGAEAIEKEPYKASRKIKKGIEVLPKESIAWFNLGLALHQQKKINESIKAYRYAIKYSNSKLKEARNNLAQDLLLIGETKEGWNLYERRLDRMQDAIKIYIALYGKPWEGFKDNRPCDNLLVVAEQGLGDTIQFCRLMQLIINKNIKASLFCQEAVAKLLKDTRNLGDIRTSLTIHKKNTRWCSLMSLPKILELDMQNIPYSKGYIQVSDKYINKWKKILKRKKDKVLIAIHWQGNPKFERKLYSKGRSMKFKYFKNLARINNVEFLSIQKGSGEEQRMDIDGISYVDGQKEFDLSYDFRDTAGALKNCDLLISADSSVVHLAGAIGVPVWVALSWVPEWRWGLEGKSTPWYKSARLFRQDKPGDWENLMIEVRKVLEESISNKYA